MRRLLVLGVLLLAGCEREASPGIDVAEALGGIADAGFARAEAPRRFRFPEDHGAHRDFRNEWWYVTGQMQAPNGERFGYQVTFFRIALAAEAPERDSAWATRQLWMAHAALTEVDGGRHHHAQRFARAGLGLAGQENEPFRVWLEDWALTGGPAAAFPWTLSLATGDFTLDLALDPLREPLLQGKDGLSQKSAAPGNASYYYSITRLATRGTLRRGDEVVAVEGLSWLDREWSTSALGDDQVGWDWFSLHFDNGDDLMLYRLRDCRGATDPYSAGTLLRADGPRRSLGAADFALRPLRYWTSPSGARYPVAWALELPGLDLSLEAEALLDDQEMLTGVRYWEGAVALSKPDGGASIGAGYLEMTGYAAGARSPTGAGGTCPGP